VIVPLGCGGSVWRAWSWAWRGAPLPPQTRIFCVRSKPTTLISWLARVAEASASQRGLRGEGGTPARPAVSQGHHALAGEGVEGLEGGQAAVDAGFARHERFGGADVGEAVRVDDDHAGFCLH